MVDGETGLLVPFESDEGVDRAARPGGVRARASPSGINALVRDPDRAAEMGRAGRERAVREFDWSAIARQTSELYRDLAS